ncbi:hypothetical protein, partial [Psychrobacter sp. 1U2]|uniref:hypothetical protein n=1 Tax=Psychrobacter sp. 1U2 TaxID=3453577 RepID=UPI003F6E130A
FENQRPSLSAIIERYLILLTDGLCGDIYHSVDQDVALSNAVQHRNSQQGLRVRQPNAGL